MKSELRDWVTHQAERRPTAAAVAMGQERLTYAQLELASNQLAHTLREAGCHKGDRVCFLMPKSPVAIVSMIGIQKAGCVYVPVDTASPAARIHKIIDSCESRWLLSAGPVTSLLDELFSDEGLRTHVSIGWMEPGRPDAHHFTAAFSRDDLDLASGCPLPQLATVDDPAHILFTSGSTGTPKGVVITHANVIRFVEWGLKHFGINSSERISGHAPLHFDLSTFDVFATFAAGAELHLVPHDVTLLPSSLAEFIRTAELTQWLSVPSVLNYMAKSDVVKFNDFPALQRLLWCGEVLPTPALIYWMQRLPHVRFTNLYGPTEATIASSYYDVPECPVDEKAPIPIGTACDGEELLVLDEQFQPAPPGVVGELYIGGVGLSPGYWRDPGKTAAAFLPDPRRRRRTDRIYRTGDLARRDEEGLIYFLGRADSQIKSRGYRIELGEIEAALNSLSCLQEGAVVAIPSDGFEGWTICCAYVAPPEAQVTPLLLRKELARLIPSYMLPSRWIVEDVLPKNRNGKIDRSKLKECFLQVEKKVGKEEAFGPLGRKGRKAS